MLQCLFTKKSKALVGIDIGSSSVKLLELSLRARRYRVESYASYALPENAVVEKSIKGLEAVAESLQQLALLTRTRGASAAVAVAGSAVITKTIEMDAALSDADMENQIVVEADQYIPFPLDEVAIDFERQRPSPRKPDRVEVLLAACKKENVDLRVAALELGGFRARVVDIEAYAMERAYRLLREQMGLPEHRLVALFDIGATMTTLYILLKGTAIYTREQLFGGLQLQQGVRKRYGLAPQEADTAIGAGSLPEGFEAELLFPFRQEISDQAGRALQVFFSSSQYNEVDLIVLAGGVAATSGLAQHLEESLAIRTLVARPCARLSLGPKVNRAQLEQDAAALMMACGLALRGL